MRARIEAQTVCNSSDRRNRPHQAKPGQIARRSSSVESLSSEGIFRRTNSHRFACEQRIDAGESCCKRANLRVAISATQFMERLKDFPWPERVLKLDELVPRIKRQIIFWWLMALLVPAGLLLRLLQIPKKGGPA